MFYVCYLILCTLHPFARPAVIEKVGRNEGSKEFYHRMKGIHVDEFSQELKEHRPIRGEVEAILQSNPLLQKMDMFKENAISFKNPLHVNVMSGSEDDGVTYMLPRNLTRIAYKPLDDNFDDEYRKVNESLFNEFTNEPTGRSLSDDTLQFLPTDGTQKVMNEETTEDPPFAVTAGLLKDWEMAGRKMVSRSETKEIISSTPAGLILLGASTSTTISSPGNSIEREKKNHISTENEENKTENNTNSENHIISDDGKQRNNIKFKTTSEDRKFGLPLSLFRGLSYPSVYDQIPVSSSGKQKHNEGTSTEYNGRYKVTGTHYYHDNRIEGNIYKEDKYDSKPDRRELKDMLKDRRFAIEVEVSKLNDALLQEESHPKQRGTKLAISNFRKWEGEKSEPFSTVTVVEKKGKRFERRKTHIGGRTVTVELGNPRLHGIDLIARPGAVVNGYIPTSETAARRKIEHQLIGNYQNNIENIVNGGIDLSIQQKQNLLDIDTSGIKLFSFPSMDANDDDDILSPERILESNTRETTKLLHQFRNAEMNNVVNACFLERSNSFITGIPAFQKTVGKTEFDCLEHCARSSKCRSINFAHSASICELFATNDKDDDTILESLKGYTFYIPKWKNTKQCMIDNLSSKAKADITAKMDSESTTSPLRMVESKDHLRSSVPLFSKILSKAQCEHGESILFVRSSGFRNDQGSNLDTVLNINEDDCVFSCLTNMAIDSHPMKCATAEYENETEKCILSSESLSNQLTRSPHSSFYEKICVPASVTRLCSGGTIDRRPQSVLVGFLRYAYTVDNVPSCIAQCVDAQKTLGFQCLSVIYYYEETNLNCILSDASVISNPESVVESGTLAAVDYFGVDECYGLPEANESKESRGFQLNKGHPVTEDKRVEILENSRIDELRRRLRRKRMLSKIVSTTRNMPFITR